ncbi:MAG TPA: OmpA family protein [Candidatus Kapabacteria bacterium]|nr:OmpA family protein [Candidatus Kapabacteria bacterium]
MPSCPSLSATVRPAPAPSRAGRRVCLLRVLALLALLAPAALMARDIRRSPDLSFGLDYADIARGRAARVLDVVNTDDREEKPLVSADGLVMFFTSDRRDDRPWANYLRMQNRYDMDVWVSTRLAIAADGESWSQPVNLGAPINSSGDEDVAAIAPDGQGAYFTSLRPGWESDGGPFYHARLKGARWSELRGLGGGINDFFNSRDRSVRFKVYGASISADGASFYFATTLNSPDGTQQIWVSHLRDGVWGFPQNLGPSVNGPGGSCAPFIAADGKTLFFAADRPQGYGGDDIYMTVKIGGTWLEAENVGAPINTAGDDAFLSVPASGERVYLSSSRDGDNDIFVAPLPEIMRPGQVVILGGRVIDRVSGEPIAADIAIEDLRSGVTIYNAVSNASSGRYTLVLEPGRDYAISVSASGYGFSSHRYTVPVTASYDERQNDILLEPLRSGSEVTLTNIFYDYNSFELRPESQLELNRLVRLMSEREGMRITVCGHTDSVGGERYNAQLSLRRAEAVRRYVSEVGGIDAARIDVRGLGSAQPAAPNDTEEGRQKNRRITFVVE